MNISDHFFNADQVKGFKDLGNKGIIDKGDIVTIRSGDQNIDATVDSVTSQDGTIDIHLIAGGQEYLLTIENTSNKAITSSTIARTFLEQAKNVRREGYRLDIKDPVTARHKYEEALLLLNKALENLPQDYRSIKEQDQQSMWRDCHFMKALCEQGLSEVIEDNPGKLSCLKRAIDEIKLIMKHDNTKGYKAEDEQLLKEYTDRYKRIELKDFDNGVRRSLEQ